MKIADLVSKPGRASSWKSVRHDDRLHIYHYATMMAIVEDGTLLQVSEGWGSMSDKCGMAKLRHGARLAGLEVG
jgi:hypothetical protein